MDANVQDRNNEIEARCRALGFERADIVEAFRVGYTTVWAWFNGARLSGVPVWFETALTLMERLKARGAQFDPRKMKQIVAKFDALSADDALQALSQRARDAEVPVERPPISRKWLAGFLGMNGRAVRRWGEPSDQWPRDIPTFVPVVFALMWRLPADDWPTFEHSGDVDPKSRRAHVPEIQRRRVEHEIAVQHAEVRAVARQRRERRRVPAVTPGTDEPPVPILQPQSDADRVADLLEEYEG